MSRPAFTPHPSPNHGPRPAGSVIDMLVLHYTGMETGQAALDRLCDPAFEVSAHYLVLEDGHTLQLVPEHRRAWHAGRASWRGAGDVNSRSIGVELAHPGHAWGYRPFAAAQIEALMGLCCGLLFRHAIPARNVVGHSDIAPNRKEDPGELFPWLELAQAGIGLMPGPCKPISAPALTMQQRALAAYGYNVQSTGRHDLAIRNAVLAFQRHFRPSRMDGVFDGECAALLADLCGQAGCALPADYLT